MHYVINKAYVNTNNPNIKFREEYVEITKTPLMINGRVHIEDGWIGKVGDWTIDSHGQFSGYVEAYDRIRRVFGEVQNVTNELKSRGLFKDAIVVFRVGEHHSKKEENPFNQIAHYILKNITAKTTDEDLVLAVNSLRTSLNFELHKALSPSLIEFVKSYRQILRGMNPPQDKELKDS